MMMRADAACEGVIVKALAARVARSVDPPLPGLSLQLHALSAE
jgi:hypothetical protein